MVHREYDVLVLGGGTAGSQAAKRLQASGLSVAMFNEGELGGLCILRGCMPTKTMLHAAHFAHEVRASATPGVRATGLEIDFRAIMANKDAKVARFKAAKLAGIDAGGYDVIDARAHFTGPDTVAAGGVDYRFRRGAVIATGSVAKLPPIEGVADVDWLTSDEVMALSEPPRSLITLGSGAIGLELTQFFARIGVPTALICRSRVLGKLDPDIAAEMARVLRDEPLLDLYHPRTPQRARRGGAGVVVELDGGDEVEGERFLLATGRRAAIDGLGLEAAGIEVRDGNVVHGPDLRTSNPRVFIAGDATGARQLLHVANDEGAIVAANVLDPEARAEVDTRLHMEVIFTDPPAAWVGRTEAQARAAGLDVMTSLVRFPETGRAITMDVEHGVSKLVADARTGELYGAQLLGPRTDDLIHTLAVILRYRGTSADMLTMPWYHPTLAEVLLSQARELEAQRGA